MDKLKRFWSWLGQASKRMLFVLVPLAAVFVVGEQVESWRLGAVAACEGTGDAGKCLRQRAYLPGPPYYPDITRRALGGFARTVGGWMGASYAPASADVEEE